MALFLLLCESSVLKEVVTFFTYLSDNLTISSYLSFYISDKIVIGSYHGILRIFNPKPTKTDGGWSGFKPEDVLLESSLQQPILQLEAGRFVS